MGNGKASNAKGTAVQYVVPGDSTLSPVQAGWFLWHVHQHKRVGPYHRSMTAALRYRVTLTRGRRDPMTNYLRGALKPATDELLKMPEHQARFFRSVPK